MSWSPLLDGATADRARELIDRITGELGRRDIEDASLGAGQAGLALLHGYRALDGVSDGADLAVAAIERALGNVMANPRPWLFYGYAGIAFVMHHLADVIGDTEDTLAELDALVEAALAPEPWKYEVELMTGVTGLGVYGLERGKPAIVERAVAHLGARAERTGDALAWRTVDPGETAYPDGYYNLGIAHGQAGAIGFLADASASFPLARDLLRGAVAWMVARERRDHVPRYPMFAGVRTVRFTGVLDGWCYGDAATAIVLIRGGLALGEPRWVERGHALARCAARRTPEELSQISLDASFCHGAISHAHLFARLAGFFDDDELRAQARSWYVRALDTAPELATTESSLQTGLTGFALGLLAGVSRVEPAWDRAFLLALPGR